MSAPIVRGQFAELLANSGIILLTMNRYREHPTQYTSIMNVLSSTKAYEENMEIVGFGPLAPKAELEPVILDRPYQTGLVRWVHQTYGLGFGVSKEMMDDDQYGVISQLAGQLGKSSRWTLELWGHDVLNNGFSTTKYVGRDGLALFANNHPIRSTGGTLSNVPAAPVDLSFTALELALQSFREQRDDRGMPIDMRAVTLHVSPENLMNARRLLESVGQPGNNNNDINTLQGSLQLVEHNYFTDQDAWFVLGPTSELGLKMYMREQPNTATWDDQNGRAAYHAIYQRHSVGFDDWRGTWGSQGA